MRNTLLEQSIKTHLQERYEPKDIFLCGDEVYTRDELDISAIAFEVEENGMNFQDYILSFKINEQ